MSFWSFPPLHLRCEFAGRQPVLKFSQASPFFNFFSA